MRQRPMLGKREYRYERLHLSDGRVLVVSTRFWSDFLSENIGRGRERAFNERLYFAADDVRTEDYPGQAFFHEHNANIRRAENNWFMSALPLAGGKGKQNDRRKR